MYSAVKACGNPAHRFRVSEGSGQPAMAGWSRERSERIVPRKRIPDGRCASARPETVWSSVRLCAENRTASAGVSYSNLPNGRGARGFSRSSQAAALSMVRSPTGSELSGSGVGSPRGPNSVSAVPRRTKVMRMPVSSVPSQKRLLKGVALVDWDCPCPVS